MVRQMADPDFCSDDHRRRYHELARAALDRLGDFEEDEAPVAEREPKMPEVREPAPEPPRQTIPMPAGTRRRWPQAPGPRLVATQQPPVPPPPPMCDLFLEPAQANDFEFALRHAPEVEFLIPPVIHADALAAAREAVSSGGPAVNRTYGFAGVPPAPVSAAAPRTALRPEPAIQGAFRSDVPATMIPALRAAIGGQFGPFSFFTIEPRPRRRFARSRTIPPPRLRVGTMVMPREPVPFAVSGVPACGALPHRLTPFAGAALFSAEPCVRKHAVCIPALPGAVPGAADAGSTEPAGICGFRRAAPHFRRGRLVPLLAGSGFGVTPATLPRRTARHPKFGRTQACDLAGVSAHAAYAGRRESARYAAVFGLEPVCRLLSPLPPLRALVLAESSRPMALHVRPVARLANNRIVEFGPAAHAARPVLPVLTLPVRISGAPVEGEIEEIVSVPARCNSPLLAASGGITVRAPRVPVFNPRIRRGRVDTTNPIPVRCRPKALESVPMDGFGGILRAPEVRMPGLRLDAGPHHGLPALGRRAVRPPEIRQAPSGARLEEASVAAAAASAPAMPEAKHAISAARRIEAGRVESKGVAPAGGPRHAVWTSVDFEAFPVLPPARAARASVAGEARSGGEMRYGAPRAKAIASAAKPGAAPFVAGPVSYAFAPAEITAPGVCGSGLLRRQPPRAPAMTAPQIAGAAFPIHAAALPVCRFEEGPGKAAGVAVAGYRRGAPVKPFAPSSSFRREPRPAPPFRHPELRRGLPLPAAGQIRRALGSLDLQPAGAIVKPQDCPPELQSIAFQDAAIRLRLAGRSARIAAAGTITSGNESHLRLTAPARLARAAGEGTVFSPPYALLPEASSRGPAAVAGVALAGVLHVNVRFADLAAARQAAISGIPLQVRAHFTPSAAMALPAIRAGARPYEPGLRPGTMPAALRRGEAAQAALCFTYPAGVFILPEDRKTPPLAGYPLFGFTYFEAVDFDDHTIVVTKSVEELLPALVIPEPEPVRRARRLPLESGALTGFIVPQPGASGLAPCGAIFPSGGQRFLPVLDGEPDTEDREELLAAAGAGGGMWKTASRFFR